jgi:hypothetical protein
VKKRTRKIAKSLNKKLKMHSLKNIKMEEPKDQMKLRLKHKNRTCHLSKNLKVLL